jgi:hypothetical protein
LFRETLRHNRDRRRVPIIAIVESATTPNGTRMVRSNRA